MKGLGTDKLRPEGKKRDATLDVTQDANNSPKKEHSGPGHFDSPVISEAGDSDGLKLSEHADHKEKEKEKEKKEEIKKSQSKEEMEKQAENDANYKRKVMEEVQTMARKMSREEIEDERKVDKKNDKIKKPEKAFSPILKAPAKSPENHKSRSDSRKKKKSKIRDEINGTKRPEYIRQDEDNSHERNQKGGGRARTPGLDSKEEGLHRKRDESDEIILNMLRENKEKEQRSGRHMRAPSFDEMEHPRPRRQHELVRGGRSCDQRESPVKSARSFSCPKKGISDPRNNDKTAPVASAQSHPPSSDGKSYFPSRRRAQLIIIVLSFCLLACLVVIIIQAAFISTKCALK